MKKILVIDDSATFSQLIEMLFSNDCEVHNADDGLEGLEKASDLKPDLILLDVMMPRMSGLEVLRQLQNVRETSQIPVIIITAQNFEARVEMSLRREPNVFSFLNKGADVNTLVSEINKAITGSSTDP